MQVFRTCGVKYANIALDKLSMEEAKLIEAIQQGDLKAFRILVDRYQKMVMNTCAGIVHDKADAEDLAQDVFLEIFRTAGSFRGEAKISTWLYRVAVNRSLNFIRNKNRKGIFQSLEQAFFGGKNRNIEITDYRSDQPDYNITDQHRSGILHRAIDRLPEKQRVAFTLNKYEDLSYQQIAEIMNLSLSSVESLIHRAKKNLQEQLYNCYKKKCI